MPMTRFLCVALASSIGAWAGWSAGEGFGILPGFLLANLGFAVGWFLGRGFVRSNLD